MRILRQNTFLSPGGLKTLKKPSKNNKKLQKANKKLPKPNKNYKKQKKLQGFSYKLANLNENP